MKCYYQRLCWLSDGSSIKKGIYFDCKDDIIGCRRIFLPCGKCKACRVNKANEWSVRCLHEMEYSGGVGCFLTLTYNNENLPYTVRNNATLCKQDLQRFFKRLRRQIEYYGLGHIRAFMACGEYGKRTFRPHYHALVFGWKPTDLEFFQRTACGSEIFRSAFIESIWKNGFVSVGEMNFQSAAYLARYTKKLVGLDDLDLECQIPFQFCSRNIPLVGTLKRYGSLGAQWCLDNLNSCFNLPYVSHIDSKGNFWKLPIPDYYLDILKKFDEKKYNDLVLKKLDWLNHDNFPYVLAFPASCSSNRLAFNILNGEPQELHGGVELTLRNLCDSQKNNLKLLIRN